MKSGVPKKAKSEPLLVQHRAEQVQESSFVDFIKDNSAKLGFVAIKQPDPSTPLHIASAYNEEEIPFPYFIRKDEKTFEIYAADQAQDPLTRIQAWHGAPMAAILTSQIEIRGVHAWCIATNTRFP